MSAHPSCGRCNDPVIRATTIPGGRRIALDLEPGLLGVYELDLDALPTPTARRVRATPPSAAVADYLGGDTNLYTPHVETCRALTTDDEPTPTGPSGTTVAPTAAGSGR